MALTPYKMESWKSYLTSCVRGRISPVNSPSGVAPLEFIRTWRRAALCNRKRKYSISSFNPVYNTRTYDRSRAGPCSIFLSTIAKAPLRSGDETSYMLLTVHIYKMWNTNLKSLKKLNQVIISAGKSTSCFESQHALMVTLKTFQTT